MLKPRRFPLQLSCHHEFMKFLILIFIAALASGFGVSAASGQTDASGRAIVVPTPTPGPAGTASTALNSSLTGGGVTHGQGSMGTGVNVSQAGATSAVPPIVPGAIIINSNANSLGTGNVAGSVQFNNGGPGSVTGAPVPISPIPTYVTPGTGLGAAATGAGITVPNPNPGSVQ
jgi:hypothetical protein